MTWLIAIARNRAIDHLRVRGQNRRMDPIEEAANLADDKPTAELALQGAQEQAQLQRYLDGLAGQRARGVARCVFRRQHLRRAC
jgi:DNA-directed RNA polymerase specialized sigma24 family protein